MKKGFGFGKNDSNTKTYPVRFRLREPEDLRHSEWNDFTRAPGVRAYAGISRGESVRTTGQ
jgi:hypothetical protein